MILLCRSDQDARHKKKSARPYDCNTNKIIVAFWTSTDQFHRSLRNSQNWLRKIPKIRVRLTVTAYIGKRPYNEISMISLSMVQPKYTFFSFLFCFGFSAYWFMNLCFRAPMHSTQIWLNFMITLWKKECTRISWRMSSFLELDWTISSLIFHCLSQWFFWYSFRNSISASQNCDRLAAVLRFS